MSEVGTRSRLHVVHLDHSRALGGAEIALRRMLLVGVPWSASIVTPRRSGADDDDDVFAPLAGSVRIVEAGAAAAAGATSARGALPLLRLGFTLLNQAVSLALSRDFRGADIVYANTTRSGLYGAMACLMSPRTVFVIHLRDGITAESLGRAGVLLFRRLVLPRADGVVANSRYTLRSAFPENAPISVPTVVIPSAAGIGATASSPGSSSAVVRRIGMLARLDPWKGQSRLLRAFARSKLPSRGVVLHLAGAAEFGHSAYEEQLRNLAVELGLGDRVVFRGHVDDVSEFVADMDVCVQASERPEPLGQNILQYLAAGKAVVAAGEGGPLDWIEPGVNGLLFEPRNEDSLREALELVSTDGSVRARLEEGARATPGLLDDATVVQRTDRFLHAVLEASGRRGRAR